MSPVVTYTAFALTMAVVLARPRLGPWRVSPALGAGAGVVALAALGAIRGTDVVTAAARLWPALAVLTSLMVMAAAAQRAGVLDALARRAGRLAAVSPARLLALAYAASWACAAVLNNDAAVVLMTPLVIV